MPSEEQLHHLLVVLGDGLDQPVPPLAGRLEVVVGDRDDVVPVALALGLPEQGAHADEVDDAPEVRLDPHGSWITSGVAPSRSLIMSTQRWNSAPTRSILSTKQIRGTPYRSACRQTVSDWGSTPATPSNTATAPSSTRSDRSTSTVKST